MVVLRRYCYNTRSSESLYSYDSWREAIADLADMMNAAASDGFSVKKERDTRYLVYNQTIRFSYYLVLED